MNVRVVQFPEGEDPDSFAKNHTEEALKTYLKEQSQDFINFKVSLLLEDTQNDPVKKAGLIRDIVTSISKIPNSIQREVYVQECSKIMEISERVLFSELAQIISKQLKENTKNQQAEKKQFEVVKTHEAPLDEINQLSILEKEIIRLLILFGNEIVDFTEEVYEVDEHGTQKLSYKNYQNTVSAEIYLHLQEDEIEFTNPVFKEIYFEMIHQLNQSEKLNIEHFIQHQNSEISGTVTSIIMDHEQHQLSDWERKNIFVTNSHEVLEKSIKDAVYNLRRILIGNKIQELITVSASDEQQSIDLEIINNYTNLKMRLYNKLNRIV